MTIALGLLALIVGTVGVVGQMVSAVDFRLAQRLGFQEQDEGTDPLYRRLELNTARWDVFVIWTLPVAGILMLLDHPWWPFAALLAGGITLDAGGREVVKILGARAAGVRGRDPTGGTSRAGRPGGPGAARPRVGDLLARRSSMRMVGRCGSGCARIDG